MKKTRLVISLMFFYSLSFAIDWEAKGMEMVGEIMSNPAAFFYDFQQDLEATSPLVPGKTFGIQTGLFPTSIPMGYANGSAKFCFHKEGRWAPGIPQLDLIGGYQNMVLAGVAANQSNDIADAKFNGHYYGFIMASSVAPKIRVFYGYKHSRLNAKLSFVDGKQPKLLGVQIDSFDSGFKDDFVILGVETLKKTNKYWSMQLNYGFNENVITGKVSWYGKWFELGLNIYPEGVLVFHPVWNFHLNF